METKHTKGQWEVTQEPFTLLVTHQVKGKTQSICQIFTRYEDEDEIEANAKLIAAAPELLDALILCLKTLDVLPGNSFAQVAARNAIKKATK